ncbi:anti-sigma factor [Rhodococcus globerulus]|uniref:anti-sigma factor n=1 Tax=Rhodococcus globerulus TaxID=33008 RepID=UPI0030190E07
MPFERAPDTPRPSVPSLFVEAMPDQLQVVRAFVRTQAGHCLSADELADLVLVVDEAASTLIAKAAPSSAMACVFDIVPGNVQVVLSVTATAPLDISTSSFGWFVLEMLVDDVALEQGPSPAADGQWVARIVLCEELHPGL